MRNRVNVALVALLWILACMVVVPHVSAQQWCGVQQLYFLDDPSGILTYKSLENFASGHAEVDENVTVTAASGPLLIDAYISSAGDPGNVVLLMGLRRYHMFAFVSATTGNTTFLIRAYKYLPNGTEQLLYETQTQRIDTTTVAEFAFPYVATQNFPFTVQDRLLIKIYGQTTAVPPITLHFLNEGSYHDSWVDSGFFMCPEIPVVQTYEVNPLPLPPVLAIAALAILGIIWYKREKR